MTDKKPDRLEENTTDLITALARGALGAAPIIGPVVAEMFTIAIPGQRVDRIVDVLRRVEARVGDIESLIETMKTPEGADLTEDALVQAARALTEERRHYIASMLRNSLTREEQLHDQKKKLFNILSQLTDHEIIFLKLYSLRLTIGSKHPFVEKHRDIIRPASRALSSEKNERNKSIFQDSYVNTLDILGLVKMEDSKLADRKPTSLSPLGNLLLDYIEVPDET